MSAKFNLGTRKSSGGREQTRRGNGAAKPRFTHLDAAGAARMVDIGAKPVVTRVAIAMGALRCRPSTISALRRRALAKGDALAVARVAGIQGAKRAHEWIPLCHPLPLDAVKVDFEMRRDRIRIVAEARATARTGVEMEALVAVSAAALALYDMAKAVDRGMRIEGVRLLSKTKVPRA